MNKLPNTERNHPMEALTLNNGIECPAIGIGTYEES